MRKIRGRGYASTDVIWQAHEFSLPEGRKGEGIGLRLACDADVQSGRGGSWKSDSSTAPEPWRVDEWSRTGHHFFSFRLAHARGTEEDDWKVSVGTVHEHRPHQARKLGRDEDAPDVADEYLGFRLARDKEVK